MILSKIIQRVQSLYSKGVQSDDSRLTSRHIYNKIITVRSTLYEQKVNKRQKISDWDYQTIDCVELIKAPPYECPCIPPAGCLIYRSKYKLPKPITGLDRHIIQSVTSLDGTTVYSETSWNEKRYKSGNKYTAKNPDYFIRNDYLYITSTRMFNTTISVTGLFEDPFVALQFQGACSTFDPCLSPLDMDFPIDASTAETVVLIAAEELIAAFSQMREDQTNNTADSLIEHSK